VERPLIAVVGATATGKTSLAIALAQLLDGEVINADSRQVYRGMDIGTAKPTATEQAAARHWLIDVVDPDEQFTLAAFLDAANEAIVDIRGRGKLPVVAGGTGQYVWALIEGWRVPRVAPDWQLREELQSLASRDGPAAVAERLRAVDPSSADVIDQRNVRRMIRAIEVTAKTGRPFSQWQEKREQRPVTLLGLALETAILYARIDSRVDAMIAAGLVDEVRTLNASGYGCELSSMSGIGYRQICEYLRGECTLDDAVARIKTETHRLARMQRTWFRADDARIRWLDASSDDLVERAVAAIRDPAG
jgi:tRNA dimethylallyltransferase